MNKCNPSHASTLQKMPSPILNNFLQSQERPHDCVHNAATPTSSCLACIHTHGCSKHVDKNYPAHIHTYIHTNKHQHAHTENTHVHTQTHTHTQHTHATHTNAGVESTRELFLQQAKSSSPPNGFPHQTHIHTFPHTHTHTHTQNTYKRGGTRTLTLLHCIPFGNSVSSTQNMTPGCLCVLQAAHTTALTLPFGGDDNLEVMAT
jgi:hypothetical protein